MMVALCIYVVLREWVVYDSVAIDGHGCCCSCMCGLCSVPLVLCMVGVLPLVTVYRVLYFDIKKHVES